jgi:hypothetical protein
MISDEIALKEKQWRMERLVLRPYAPHEPRHGVGMIKRHEVFGPLVALDVGIDIEDANVPARGYLNRLIHRRAVPLILAVLYEDDIRLFPEPGKVQG